MPSRLLCSPWSLLNCLEGISSNMEKLEMAKISFLKKTMQDEIQRANCFHLHIWIFFAISSFATVCKITPSRVYCIVQTIQVVNAPSTHNPYFEWWVYCFSSFFPLGRPRQRRRRRSALGDSGPVLVWCPENGPNWLKCVLLLLEKTVRVYLLCMAEAVFH